MIWDPSWRNDLFDAEVEKNVLHTAVNGEAGASLLDRWPSRFLSCNSWSSTPHENCHDNGKPTIWRCIRGFFLYVMLVFRGVIQGVLPRYWMMKCFFVLWEELHLCDSSTASVAKALQEAIKDNQVTWCWESFDGFLGESCGCTNSGRDRWTSSWSVTWRMADIF